MIIDTDKLLNAIGYDFKNRLTSCENCDVNIIKVASIIDQIIEVEVGQRLLIDAVIRISKKYQKEENI